MRIWVWVFFSSYDWLPSQFLLEQKPGICGFSACMWGPSLFIRDKEESVLIGYVAGLAPKAWLCAYQHDCFLCCPLNSAHPTVVLSLALSSLWGKIHPLPRKAYVRRESVGINLRIVSVLTKRWVSICFCRFGWRYDALSWGMPINMQAEPCSSQGIQRGKACLNLSDLFAFLLPWFWTPVLLLRYIFVFGCLVKLRVASECWWKWLPPPVPSLSS